MFLFQHRLASVPREDERRFAKRTTAHAAASQDRVRTAWVRRLVNATQDLSGALLAPEHEALNDALIKFERCPPARTTTERLVLPGILLDVFLRLETALHDETTFAERTSARTQFHEGGPHAALSAFLAAARQLVAAANRVHSLPLHERARRWINDHVDDRRAVREIAALLGAHRRTLNRHFVRHVGKTVQEYRWECRAARAEQLLSDSNLKLDAIADAIGVRSKSTVYRVLRRSGREPCRRDDKDRRE